MAIRIRSGYSIQGVRLFCEELGYGSFVVVSHWQRFHVTSNIDEALVVFEGLCFEDYPSKEQVGNLVREARRNRRSDFMTGAAWERRVIECARRRAEGLAPVRGGSKGALEIWKPVVAP